MFIPNDSGADALTVSAGSPSGSPSAETAPEPPAATASGIPANPPSGASPRPEHIRHLIFGTLPTVQDTIRLLHHLGYAEPNDWSRPVSTGRASEVMAILTKRVSLK